MTVLIVSSNSDPASINIKKQILKLSEWKETNTFSENPVYLNKKMENVILVTINDSKIRHENLDVEVEDKLDIKLKQVIFLSRHRSKTGKPTLTTHPIGNYGNAEFGGKSKTLIPSSPRLMTCLLRLLKKNAEKNKLYHTVCFEVTHHGPFLKTPTLFVEVGSTEEEWKKEKPATVLSKSVLELLESYHYEEDLPSNIPVLIGIGGGHYAPRFTDFVFEKKVAFGHMIPSYQIDAGHINNEMFEKAISKTPNLSGIYINKKALKKSQVTEYKKYFQKIGIPVVSSKEFQNL